MAGWILEVFPSYFCSPSLSGRARGGQKRGRQGYLGSLSQDALSPDRSAITRECFFWSSVQTSESSEVSPRWG